MVFNQNERFLSFQSPKYAGIGASTVDIMACMPVRCSDTIEFIIGHPQQVVLQLQTPIGSDTITETCRPPGRGKPYSAGTHWKTGVGRLYYICH